MYLAVGLETKVGSAVKFLKHLTIHLRRWAQDDGSELSRNLLLTRYQEKQMLSACQRLLLRICETNK